MKNKLFLLGSLLIIMGALIGSSITQYLNLDMDQIEERTESYEVFYLSVGLYQNETHPCFYHDIIECKAEFKAEEVIFNIKSYNSSYEINGSDFTTAQ